MEEQFKRIGKFYLADNMDLGLAGDLLFDKVNGVVIDLKEDFEDADDYQNIIIFEDLNGQYATLLYSTRIDELKWETAFAIDGYAFHHVNELMFNSIIIGLKNLDNWLGITGFIDRTERNGDRYSSVLIEYKKPDPINFKIDDKVAGKFVFGFRRPLRPMYNVNLVETVKVAISVNYQKSSLEEIINTIANPDEMKFDDLLNYYVRFNNFLTVAFHQPTYPTSLSLLSHRVLMDDGTGKMRQKQLPLYYKLSIPAYDHKLIRPLFSYSDIGKQFNEIVQKWYSNYKGLEPVLNILFDTYYSDTPFNENKFLNISQAIETFHRRTRKNERIPKNESSKILKEIKESLSDRNYDFIKDKLFHANEPTLHTRIEELLSEFNTSILSRLIPDREQFIKDVKNSRNYYTHYDVSLEKKRLKLKELFYVTEKLKILLVCCILKETEFSMDMITSHFDRINYRYHYIPT